MPQQRRAQATRRAIVVAAAEEFEDAGYDGTPLSAILRRSGATKGAFYFHFSSKEALAVTLVRLQGRHWPRLRQRWLRRRLDPLSIAVGMADEASRLLENDVVIRAGTRLARHRIGRNLAAHRAAAEWEQVLTELLQRSAEHGLLRAGVNPVEVARVIHAAMVGVRVVGADVSPGPGVGARAAEVWQVILQGIATAEWLRSNRFLRTVHLP
ncbi:TetR family transcriptional regulator [Halopolyspora algeriensis]|uniref:TetR family transcriptional regulator n=1 Tax=Halopolyspora algeriensis TaxID=1500506 RepID=A0A368VYH8_9ACTN|nr:ScbR family autoregulator-binding transcription factor [Halopolyspora algeriensis]RCW46975.1 TetR family transcriptional regulator [Halopolyspora algeriensis]TQM48064.1 TetR family transcriptional regulator [Halopolyspora algeriensis]